MIFKDLKNGEWFTINGVGRSIKIDSVYGVDFQCPDQVPILIIPNPNTEVVKLDNAKLTLTYRGYVRETL